VYRASPAENKNSPITLLIKMSVSVYSDLRNSSSMKLALLLCYYLEDSALTISK